MEIIGSKASCVYALMVDEEMARKELSKNIDSLLECINSGKSCEGEDEQVLIAVKEYIAGVKELTDLLKGIGTRDTEPHRMNFDTDRAEPTMRCIAPEKKG